MEKKPNILVIIGVVAALALGLGWYLGAHKTAEAPGEVAETPKAEGNEVTPSSTTVVDTSTPITPGAPAKPAPGKVANTALVGRRAPEFKFPSGYTNTDPILMKDLIGKKVVLVQFWTNSSVNAMRTMPYLNQLYFKYKNKGLTVLSIHTPRFAFERDKDNVDKAAFVHNMVHPIMLDNQYATWNAWGNTDWPAQYLVDINGNIVYTHKGEGDYQAMEAKIQLLLAERAKKLKLPAETYLPFEAPLGIEVVDLAKVKTPEIYFGATRNTKLSNGTALKEGVQDMKPFTTTVLNALYLSGSWEFTKEYAKSAIANNTITLKYSAKNVYGVLGAQTMGRVRVTLDGQPLTESMLGKDARLENGKSYVYVTEERVYDIIKGAGYGEHLLEMVSENSGLQVYDLMFG